MKKKKKKKRKIKKRKKWKKKEKKRKKKKNQRFLVGATWTYQPSHMVNLKFGVEISHNRRALGSINQKGGAQLYPCVVNKRASLQVHRPITR